MNIKAAAFTVSEKSSNYGARNFTCDLATSCVAPVTICMTCDVGISMDLKSLFTCHRNDVSSCNFVAKVRKAVFNMDIGTTAYK